MAKAYMERIEALRQQYLNTRVDMDVYNAKYVTEGDRGPALDPPEGHGVCQDLREEADLHPGPRAAGRRRGLQTQGGYSEPGQRLRSH